MSTHRRWLEGGSCGCIGCRVDRDTVLRHLAGQFARGWFGVPPKGVPGK